MPKPVNLLSAPRTEGRLTTIRHGGPCGLRIEMRAAERPAKLADFHVTNAANVCHRVKGGGVTWVFAQVHHSHTRLYDSVRCG